MDLARRDPQYMTEYMPGYRSQGPPWHQELLKAERIIHQFFHRNEYTRRQFSKFLATGLSLPIAKKLAFGGLIEKWPTARQDQHNRAWEDILEMRTMLARGEEDAQVHDKAISLRTMLAHDRSREASRLRIHCYEVLRDAGEEGSSKAKLTLLLAYARWVTNAWRRENHELNQAQAQLTEMSLWRTRGHYGKAWEILKETDALLTSLQGKKEYNQEMVSAVRSQAALWRFRIVSIHHQKPWEAERERTHLQGLADKVGTSLVSAETLREEVGHLMMHARLDPGCRLRHLADAEQKIEEALRVFKTLPAQPPRVYLTFLRAQIELLFMTGEKHKARGIVKDYLDNCRKHPLAHCFGQIQSLGEKYPRGMGEDLLRDIEALRHNIPPRQSSMLFYFYLDGTFAKL